jgi:hypothetical protein
MSVLISRRFLLGTGVAAGGIALASSAFALPVRDGLSPILAADARAALARHRDQVEHVDRIGIVDFGQPSRVPRLYVLNLGDGVTTSHLVAHGRGSDPAHSGWVSRLSNEPGSFASSGGAYVTRGLYVGGHGRSMRLAGLDRDNSNAELRALVVHAAWYVSPAMARDTGKLGRSEGCFAVSGDSLDAVLEQLGPGRLIFASGIAARQLDRYNA